MLSEEERKKVDAFLNQMKACLATNDVTYKPSDKNQTFNNETPMTDVQRKKILLSLTVDDCVKVEPNNNPLYPDAEVFVFLKAGILVVYGEDEAVELYIKMYIRDNPTHRIIIVISFHKAGMHDS